MGNNLHYFRNVLENGFIHHSEFLEEPQANMRVQMDKAGCTSFVFNLDKKLPKQSFRGGLFPFFNPGEPKVSKACDYLIFMEVEAAVFCLVVELKKGSKSCEPQLLAGECFARYVEATVNRVYNTQINLNVRKIAIKQFKRKYKTKYKGIEYNAQNTHEFTDKCLKLSRYSEK